MATIFEIEKLALDLPELERAKLAANPNQAINLAQLDSEIQSRRG